MTEEEKPMSEVQSLALITEMIEKAKSHFHQNGTSAILWGSVIGFCGIFTFIQNRLGWQTGSFSVWYLALIAIIPHIFIGIRERKQRIVKTHLESATDAVWTVHWISVFALFFYFQVVPDATEQILAASQRELLLKQVDTGITTHWRPVIWSQASLLMILYAIPTMVTGIASRFKPMIAGGVICYCLFIISCFTSSEYDWLLNGAAGIFNWLIPGLILRKRYFKAQVAQHV